MEINGNNSLASPTATRIPEQEQTQGAMGRDAFMKLLVTQLQNQDPLDPMDAREMVSQLSELTSVEKLAGIEHRLTALEIANAGMANTQVSSLVGKTVTADASSLRLEEAGAVNGVYRLEGSAEKTTITIRDEAGRAVRTVEVGPDYPGEHSFEWDGNDDSGTRMPPGRYTMEIRAESAEGTPVDVSTEITGMVDAVSYENGYPELLVGEARLLLGDVTSIGDVKEESE